MYRFRLGIHLSITIIIDREFVRKLSNTTLAPKKIWNGLSPSHRVLLTRDIVAKQSKARALIRAATALAVTCDQAKILLIYGILATSQDRLDLWNVSTAAARTSRVHCRRLHTSRTQSRLSSNKTRLSREILQNSTAKRE